MAQEARTGAASAQLSDLARRAQHVSLYQAILMIERWYGGGGFAAVGHDGPAEREVLRLRPSLSLAHPTADVESIELDETGPAQITATFLGLYGADSPLPLSFAERLCWLEEEPAGARLREFLDIFHHRLYSMLFRAWRKARPVSTATDRVDPLYDRALSFAGFSQTLGLGGEVPPLNEARLLVLRSRTAHALRALLRRRLGRDCELEQLIARRVPIPQEQRSQVGRSNTTLGQTLVAGANIHDRNKIRVRIAAGDFEDWLHLSPEGSERQRVDQVIDRYLHTPLDYEVEVTLEHDEVPACRLGEPSHQLGRSAWLGKPRPFARVRWQGKRRDA